MGRKIETPDEAHERMKAVYREYYWFYRSHGICVKCKQEKASPGHAHCDACLDELRKNGYNARRYREAKAAGLCVVCRKVPAREGRVTCAACAKEHNRQSVEYQRRMREAEYL